MKKLIDVAAVKQLRAEGKEVVNVDKNTLITPAARDEISKYEMRIQEGEDDKINQNATMKNQLSSPQIQKERTVIQEDSTKEISIEMIFNVLSYLHKTGLLQRQDELEQMLDSYVQSKKTL